MKAALKSGLFKLIKASVVRDAFYTRIGVNIYNYLINKPKLSVYTIKPLTSLEASITTELSPSSAIYNYPEADSNGEQTPYEKKLPALCFRKFNAISVMGNFSGIIKDDSLYYQPFDFKTPYQSINIAPELLTDRGVKTGLAVSPKKSHQVEKGIFLGGSWAVNWFHWAVEIMSKSIFIEQLPNEYQNWPLLVPDFVSEFKNHRDLLNKLLPDKSIVYIPYKENTPVKHCIWIDSICQTPPYYYPISKADNPEDYIFDIHTLTSYRNKLLNQHTSVAAKYPKRLFLSRGKSRPFNEEEIFGEFQKIGFEKVFLEHYSFSEQIQLFKEADMIAGPTGAAWTGLLFAKAEAKCICWSPYHLNKASVYANLAKVSGCDLRFINYNSIYSSWVEAMVANETYHIDIQTVQELIHKWMIPTNNIS